MDEYLQMLAQAPLFSSFSPEELRRLFAVLRPALLPFGRGQVLLAAGAATREIGVVLEGQIEAAKYTRSGGRFTVAQMGPGGVFGDVLSGSHRHSPVTVCAAGDGMVMLLDTRLLFGRPAAEEELHRRLLANLVAVISDKYFSLDERVELLLIHGLRRRVAAYLLATGSGAGGGWFPVPFGRSGLASYLGCERSALSREISRMAADGLIETGRRRFRIANAEALKALC